MLIPELQKDNTFVGGGQCSSEDGLISLLKQHEITHLPKQEVANKALIFGAIMQKAAQCRTFI